MKRRSIHSVGGSGDLLRVILVALVWDVLLTPFVLYRLAARGFKYPLLCALA